jgi:GNAT superfamily N-acetyltransferase
MQAWSITREPTEAELRTVSEGVLNHGRSLAFAGRAKPIACLLRHSGEIVAGATGRTEYERLFVQYLWVTSSRRGEGLGTQALTRLERAAQLEGCQDSLIETLDEGVAQFYVRLGYRELAVVGGYVGPFSKHILLKYLGVRHSAS